MKLLSLFLLLCLQVMAQEAPSNTQTFVIEESLKKQFQLINEIEQTKYRTETRDSTCYEQVPYQENVCHDVTKYRNECYTEPSYQDCQTVYERQCHSVTRHRQECSPGPTRQECHRGSDRRQCSPGPTRQECHTTPSRQSCHTTASKQVCRNVPGKERCTTRPSKRVCRKLPNGKQHCQTIPSKRVCHTSPSRRVCKTIPGQRICKTIPGQRKCRTVRGPDICRNIPGDRVCRTVRGADVCRQVAYQEQECSNVPRQSCHTIPSKEVCKDVAYQGEECNEETRYTQEPYDCQEDIQVPYQEIVKILQADMDIVVESQVDFKPSIIFELTKEGKIKIDTDHRATLELKIQELESDVTEEGKEVKILKKLDILILKKELPKKVKNKNPNVSANYEKFLKEIKIPIQ